VSAPRDLPSPTVVVLTHASARTLPSCIDALRPQVAEVGGQLLVVDNASPDDTVAVAARLGVDVVATGGNLGFARGCNLAAESADGEVLILVNPDAVPDPGCLGALLSAVRDDPGAGPIGGRARFADGTYDPRCVLGRPCLRGALGFATGLSTLLPRRRLTAPEDGPPWLPADGGLIDVEVVSGALMAVPMGLWRVLGGFDERYFLYGEDVDLCLRAQALGWQPVVATRAGYSHVGGASSSTSRARDVWLHRGKAELYYRHLGPRSARLAVSALQAGAGLRGLAARAPRESIACRGRRWADLHADRALWRDGYRYSPFPTAPAPVREPAG
jgi:N-acetylglucosaminyl-diphospho-decaprenol L-rhamnosyltransferase